MGSRTFETFHFDAGLLQETSVIFCETRQEVRFDYLEPDFKHKMYPYVDPDRTQPPCGSTWIRR